MGISPFLQQGTACVVLLNLHWISDPYTGVLIDCTLDAWGIPEEKILLVVTDNGGNIVKAISLLQNRQENTRDQQQPEQTIALNGTAMKYLND
jgi:hypothetical protein